MSLPKDVLVYKIIPEIQLPLLERIAELEARLSQAICSERGCNASIIKRYDCAVCSKLLCSDHVVGCDCCYRIKKYCSECIVRFGSCDNECPEYAEDCDRSEPCGRRE
jgi:hypothetical protein